MICLARHRLPIHIRFFSSFPYLLNRLAPQSSNASKKPKLGGSPAIYPHTNVKPPNDFSATKFRHWIELTEPSNHSFSIMSYNLLSQHYVWKEVFGSLDKRFLDWPHYRFPLINEVIRQLPCDIMCFQELECLVYKNQWCDNYPLEDYELVYIQKPNPAYWGTKPSEFMDGVGIFINTKRFKLVSLHGVNFGKYVTANPEKFDITKDIEARLVPRNTVAAILHLQDKLSGENVFVSNTHLYWLPLYNDVKVMQTKILLNALDRLISSTRVKNPRVIMCGDFNSTPELLVFRLLKEGFVSMDDTKDFTDYDYGSQVDGESLANRQIINPFSLAPVYGPLLNDSNNEKLEFTSYTKRFPLILDHIWCSTEGLRVNSLLGKVDSNYCENAAGFPDNYFPSDHIPLISKISYE